MQINEYSFKRLKYIYNNLLKNIDSIEFTSREIDIISCILFNRSEKKIADILGISYRTVSCHVSNIMRKLSCSTKDQIIDFIETSGKHKYCREYYYNLMIYSKFLNLLNKIGSKLNTSLKKYTVSLDEDNSQFFEAFTTLRNHLKLANINLEISNTGYGISENKIRDDYYTYCLELLTKILVKSEINKLIQSFSKEKEILINSFANPKIKGSYSKPKSLLDNKFSKYSVFAVIILFMSFLALTQNTKIQNYLVHNTNKDNVIRYNLQKDIYYFVNHKSEIKELRSKLIQRGKIGITGITGKGKTVLATRYANLYKDNYEIIAHFNGDIDLLAQYIALAKRINNTICKDGKCHISLLPSQVTEDIKKFLSSRSKWLLIFDNLQINQNDKIKNMLQWDNNGHIIITTQDSKYIKNKLELSYFSQKDTHNMINKISNKISDELKQKIFNITKGHPYLISRIASFIDNYQHKNIDEIVEYIISSDNPADSYIELLLNNISNDSKEILNKVILLNNQYISKEYLKQISNLNKNDFNKALDELIRFSILEQVNSDISNPRFAIHDLLSKKLINKSSKKDLEQNVNAILDVTNAMLPETSMALRYNIINGDDCLIGNIEKLLINSDHYDSDFYKSMKLRKYLLDYYMSIVDHKNCHELCDWLLNKLDKIDIKKMNDDQIDVFAYYLIKIGFFKHETAEQNYKEAIKYYKKARKISKHTNKIISKFVSRYQMASALTTVGRLSEAKDLLKDLPNIDKSIENKLHYFQARISLAEGNFEEALTLINEGINNYAKLNDTKTRIFYNLKLLQVEILNYVGNSVEAYKIVKQLHGFKKNHIVDVDSINGKILTQLAWAEHLQKYENKNDYIDQAISILEQNLNYPMAKDTNSKALADAYATKSQCLKDSNEIVSALEYCNKAKIIYRNLYEENTEQISYFKRIKKIDKDLLDIVNVSK